MDSEIIKELRRSGISKEMRSLESSDWVVLAEVDEKIVGVSGVGGLFNLTSIQVLKKIKGIGLGGLIQREMINESKKEVIHLSLE